MNDAVSIEQPTTVRDRLLDAAERAVARDGMQGLTLEAVAREAGVSKGGLLYHFPSKRELIIAVVERLGERCEADQKQAELAGGPGCGAFARAYVTARHDALEEEETKHVHVALLAAAATDPQYLEPFRRRLVEWQAKLEADGIDPAVATIVRLAMDGLCLGVLFGMPVPQGNLRLRIIEKLIEMTKPEKSE